MRTTIDVIGDSIVEASRFLPIRNRAAALATKANPKDYLGQVRHIYDDFVKRWRYVRDPYGRELVVRSPRQIYELVMGGNSDSPGVGLGRGAGDCDDATVAIGAQLASIGFPVRIATIAPQNAPPGNLMSHVFCQAQVPGVGWVTVDPVVHPHHQFGYTPPGSRLATFDLRGKLTSQSGNARGLSGTEKERQDMRENIDTWQDFAGFGDVGGPEDELLDFRIYGMKDFGIYSDSMGMMGGLGLVAEVDVDETGRAWTPNIELAPHDYQYLQNVSTPYDGMLGLGDNGEVYEYDSGLGFFKKMFRKIRKGARWLKKKAKKLAKKLLKRLPGGKYLLKLGKKVWKVAKKLIKPLAKLVGPLAKKLAPIAALIPGYGPAIAAGLKVTGKIAGLMKKHGVKIASKKKGPAALRFPSGGAAKAFEVELKRAARKHKKQTASKKRRVRKAIARGIAPIRRRRRARRRYLPASRRIRAY